MEQVRGETRKVEATTIHHADTLQELPSPSDFSCRFVQSRRPVLIQGCASAFLENPDILHQLGDVSKLLAVVEGDAEKTVEVNQVSSGSTTSSFSPQSGSTVLAMSLKDFCEKLTSGSTDYYMTTQTLPTDDEGRPAVTNWLTERLLREEILPLRPTTAGKLIPMNVGNLWMGKTSTTGSPSSSGLHHDFHDNFYCLVAGTKRIRLAPPQSVHQLTMVGHLHTLHPNGRIVYQEQIQGNGGDSGACPIRPDGALVSVERIVQLEMRKEEIERKLEAESSEEKKELLEEELNVVEEELLDIEMVGDETDRSSNADDESACDSIAGSDKEEPGVLFQVGSKRTRSESSSGDAKRVRSSSREKDDNQTRVPPNFVNGTPSVDDAPRFQEIHMKAGDVLYLPAGWFHEVFSAGLHMAVNYWFHPPDTGSTFEAPYQSQFWQRDWDARGLS